MQHQGLYYNVKTYLPESFLKQLLINVTKFDSLNNRVNLSTIDDIASFISISRD